MARARNIKPGFFKNEVLAQLPFSSRLLFVGLWCLADREGRLEDRPLRIKGEVFPFDEIDTDAGLGELHQTGFIFRYEAKGRRYIQVENFVQHQRPHYKEEASKVPAPDRKSHNGKPMQPEKSMIGQSCVNVDPTLTQTRADVGSSSGQPRVNVDPNSVQVRPEFESTLVLHDTLNPDLLNADPLIPLETPPTPLPANPTVSEQDAKAAAKAARAEARRRREAERKAEAEAVEALEIPAALDTEAFRSVWELWKHHRREKGESLKKSTAVMQLKKLVEYGEEEAVQKIELSIANDYQGLFFKGDKPNGNTPARGRPDRGGHGSTRVPGRVYADDPAGPGVGPPPADAGEGTDRAHPPGEGPEPGRGQLGGPPDDPGDAGVF